MPDLLARGPDPQHQWRKHLPAHDVTLGSRAGHCDWVVPWDNQISRLHATLTWQNETLRVRREPKARNKIFFRGQEAEDFCMLPGEHFVIGKTEFVVEASEPTPDETVALAAHELQQVPYVDADVRIEALAVLPGLIRHSPSDEQLESRVIDVLLRGIPRALAAAVVRVTSATAGGELAVQVQVFRGRDVSPEGFQPSRRLVLEAVEQRRQSVLHYWRSGAELAHFTQTADSNWAICVPLLENASLGLALYVVGRLHDETGLGAAAHIDRLKSDLKFAELVGDIFGSLRQARDLQRRYTLLERFFSRPVRSALAQQDMNVVLKPRVTEVTVLFCDLRGSCRTAEEGEQDLPRLWERVGDALDVMASSIIDQDGVIGDFQGDAAMGFWGWPLDSSDQIDRAARAALNIRRRFAQAAHEPGARLAGFACGIGLASGPAMVGRLGTMDQFKVDVFGPVVNLASRLETLTKRVGVPILVDEQVAAALGHGSHAWLRCRRLARVRPFGMQRVLMLHELLPRPGEPGTLSERERRDYETGLNLFLEANWRDARLLLDRLPYDGAAQFLRDFMDRYDQKVPADWDRVIALDSK
jgi:adenylate cyclase